MKRTRKQQKKLRLKEKNKQKRAEKREEKLKNQDIKNKTVENNDQNNDSAQQNQEQEQIQNVIFDVSEYGESLSNFEFLQKIRQFLFQHKGYELNSNRNFQKIINLLIQRFTSNNTQKSLQDYINPQIKELRTYLAQKQKSSNKLDQQQIQEYFEKKVKIIIVVDEIYFKIYYQSINSLEIKNWEQFDEEKHPNILDPLTFLKKTFDKKTLRKAVKKQEFIDQEFRNLYEIDEKGKNISENNNYLLALLQQRMKETYILFQNNSDDLDQKQMFKNAINTNSYKINLLDNEFDSGPRGPPIAYPILQAWRENCRDWACWLYSYAVLNKKNLQTICKNMSCNIIEVGAGTGYISYQLQEHKKALTIKAFDIHPTSDTSNPNEYHRNSPEFIEVKAGGVEVLKQEEFQNYDMLISYPPPKNNMAFDAIKAFKGNRFAYIGEWKGVTANDKFEAYLLMNYRLIVQEKVPVFDDQTCDLTIWERREAPLDKFTYIPWEDHTIKCSECTQIASMTDYLYKCMYCRDSYYCSEKCLNANKDAHDKKHKQRAIAIDSSQISIKNDSQFTQIQPIKLSQRLKSEIGNKKTDKRRRRRNVDEEEGENGNQTRKQQYTENQNQY